MLALCAVCRMQDRENELRKQVDASQQLEQRMQRWQSNLARKEQELNRLSSILDTKQSELDMQRRSEMVELRRMGRTLHREEMIPALAKRAMQFADQSTAQLDEVPSAEQWGSVLESAGAVEPLVDLLCTGSESGKTEAAAALRQLAEANERMQCAIADAGALVHLVRLVKHGSSSAQCEAAGAIASLTATNAANREGVLHAGGVEALAVLLIEGSAEAKQVAVVALQYLSQQNLLNQDAIAKAGCVPPLAKLLKDGNGTMRNAAAACLCNLAEHDQHRQELISEAGAIGSLVSLIRNGDDAGRLLGAAAIASIARDNARSKLKIFLAGATEPLLDLLHSRINGAEAAACRAFRHVVDVEGTGLDFSPHIVPALVSCVKPVGSDTTLPVWVADAAAALLALVRRGKAYLDQLHASHAIPTLVHLLKHGSATELATVAAILSIALFENSAAKQSVAKEGGIGPLVQLLRSGPEESKVHAARSLGEMACATEVLKEKICWEGAVAPLVELLKLGSADAKEAAAFALRMLPTGVPSEAEVRDGHGPLAQLLPLLQGGTISGKEAAAWALGNLTYNRDQPGVHAAERHCIPPLVELLKLGTDDAKEAAVIALQSIGRHEENRPHIKEAAAIGPLLSTLWLSNARAKTAGCDLLGLLAHNDLSVIDQILQVGGMNPLLALLRKGEQETKRGAARLLVILADRAGALPSETTVGWVPSLIKLIASGERDLQEASVCALSRLVDVSLKCRECAYAENASQPILAYLRQQTLSSEHASTAHASDALEVLTSLSRFGSMRITSEEVDFLISFLQSAQSSAAAAKLMCSLVHDEKIRANAVMGGLVPPLLQLLMHSSVPTQVFAAETFAQIGVVPDENLVAALVAMLESADSRNVRAGCRGLRTQLRS